MNSVIIISIVAVILVGGGAVAAITFMGDGDDDFTVTFEAKNGKVDKESIKVPGGTTWKAKETGSLEFSDGTKVTASPDPGYVFSKWTPVSGEVTADTKISAVFEKDMTDYTVTIAVDAKAGSVDKNDFKVRSGTTWTVKDDVLVFSDGTRVTAEAAKGYYFAGWSPDVGTVTKNTTIAANFDNKPAEYTITFVARENGTVDTQSLTIPAGVTWDVGKDDVLQFSNGAKVTAKANEGAFFDSWSPYKGTVREDRTIEAIFSTNVPEYTISFRASEGGTVSDGSAVLAKGTTWTSSGTTLTFKNGKEVVKTVTATPADGYVVKSWNPASGTVKADATVDVVFAVKPTDYSIYLCDNFKNDEFKSTTYYQTEIAPIIPGIWIKGNGADASEALQDAFKNMDSSIEIDSSGKITRANGVRDGNLFLLAESNGSWVSKNGKGSLLTTGDVDAMGSRCLAVVHGAPTKNGDAPTANAKPNSAEWYYGDNINPGSGECIYFYLCNNFRYTPADSDHSSPSDFKTLLVPGIWVRGYADSGSSVMDALVNALDRIGYGHYIEGGFVNSVNDCTGGNFMQAIWDNKGNDWYKDTNEHFFTDPVDDVDYAGLSYGAWGGELGQSDPPWPLAKPKDCRWAYRGNTMRNGVLIPALAICAIMLIASNPIDGADDRTGFSETYDGSVYGYLRYTMPDYHSEIKSLDAGSDTFHRLQSRLEGFAVTIIGDGALSGNPNVRTFLVPESVATMGSRIFAGCTGLESIIFMGPLPTVKSDTFDGLPSGVSVSYTERYSDSWKGFSTLPKSILDVRTHSGPGCSFEYAALDGSITVLRHLSGSKITIPATLDAGGSVLPVKRIGPSAFLYQENAGKDMVVTVDLPEGLECIDVAAFKYCEKLESVRLPSTLKVIDDEAFRMEIDSVNWARSALKSVDLPHGLEYIGFESFRMCYSIREVTVPDTVTHYGDGAFRCCSAMVSLKLPSGLKVLSDSALDHCYALKNITLPQGLEKIGGMAFFDCNSLESITIPDSVKSIGNSAFSGCSSLQRISVSDGVAFGKSCFNNAPLQTLVITSPSSGSGLMASIASDWTLPGLEKGLSLMVIDTSFPINAPSSGPGFLRLSSEAVNVAGGVFKDGDRTLTGAERAGKTYESAGSWSTVEAYTVDWTSEKPSKGTVVGGGTFKAGTTVEFDAVPKRFCEFTGWSDGIKDASRTVSVLSDMHLSAGFVDSEIGVIRIIIDPEESGIYTGAGRFAVGTTVDISVTPMTGYNFIGWSDGVKEPSRKITVTGDAEYTASFGNLTISFDVNGGKVPIPEMYSNHGWKITLPGTDETIDGKTIVAWTIDGKEYDVGKKYETSESVTAVAIWGVPKEGVDPIVIAIVAIAIVAVAGIFFAIHRFR